LSSAATAGAERAQGVCRGQSSNRGVRERSGVDFLRRCLRQREGRAAGGLKRNEKRKSGIEKCRSVDRNQRTRWWSLAAPATLPNEQAVAALPHIQHILDANRLIKGKAAGGRKERKRKWGIAKRSSVAADSATQQIVVAYGAGDASKRGSRGCSSLHSAHT
jgi:hypothetical protein